MTNRSETFARLLKGAVNSIAAYEGKTAPAIEHNLGEQIGVSGATIQRWKSGTLPTDERAVEILAEAAVRRGYLGREWLQRFLYAARYPFSEKLLDQLCPIGPARPRPPRVYHNLPAPTYSQFVMRAQAFAEMREGLGKQSAIVLIVGLGGNGKTSLAREAAARCLADNGDMLRVDAAVWVSDKDRPGTTNLSVVLDEIARTLDYPGFTQFEHDEKRHEVENLLRRQRVLIVVDNFETITDGALLSWLQNLSEPSKALITAREYRREYRRGGWLVELRGMTDAEAHEFAGERLRMLRIAYLVNDQAQLEPLLVATGGNPKALELALGLVKYERRPLQQVVDDLYAARGELFDDLFTRAWALLDEATRRVLLVMTFFPASASGAALSATADVQGFAFDHAIERLTDLALLDAQQENLNSAPRYTLHPLVRAFTGARLTERLEFEKEARKRWVTWYIRLSYKVGYCWDDLSRLELLDPEQEAAFSVIQWTSQNRWYDETLQLAKGVGISYYFYVRGIWDKKLIIDLMHAEAARNMEDTVAEATALSYIVHVLSRQDDITESDRYLSRLQELEQSSQLSGDAFFLVQHAFALNFVAHQALDAAQQVWRKSLNFAGQFSPHRRVANRQWLATCLYRMGNLSEAQQLFSEALQDAFQHGYQRYIVFNQLRLAGIEIDQGNLETAANILTESNTRASIYQDREHLALIQRTYARLHTLRGDLPAARAALAEAIDLFERLGMRRELAEARAELARL